MVPLMLNRLIDQGYHHSSLCKARCREHKYEGTVRWRMVHENTRRLNIAGHVHSRHLLGDSRENALKHPIVGCT